MDFNINQIMPKRARAEVARSEANSRLNKCVFIIFMILYPAEFMRSEYKCVSIIKK